MPQELYIHCSIGVDEENESITRMEYTEGMTASDVIDHLLGNWPERVLGRHRPPASFLCVELVETGHVVEGATALGPYPPGGDVAVVVRKNNPDLYVHYEDPTEMVTTIRVDFLTYFGKPYSKLLEHVLHQLPEGVKKGVDAEVKKGRPATLSKDGSTEETSLLKPSDLFLIFPADGDLFLVLGKAVAPPPAKVSNPAPATTVASSSKPLTSSTTTSGPIPTRHIVVDFDHGRGLQQMTFDYKADKPWICENLLKEFALRMQMHPIKLVEVICLTADRKAVIPNQNLLVPPTPDTVYHLVDRPQGWLGQGLPRALGSLPPSVFESEKEKWIQPLPSETNGSASSSKSAGATSSSQQYSTAPPPKAESTIKPTPNASPKPSTAPVAAPPSVAAKETRKAIEELDDDDCTQPTPKVEPKPAVKEVPSPNKTPASAPDENKPVQNVVMEYFNAAESMCKEQKYGRAAEVLKQLLAQIPPGTEAQLPLLTRIGSIYTDAGVHHKAVDYFQKAVKIDSKSVPLAFSLAKAKYELGAFDEAVALFQECLSKAAANGNEISEAVSYELNLRLGMAQYKAGNKETALKLIQPLALNEAAQVPRSLRNLAIMWMSIFYAESQHEKDALSWACQLLIEHQKGRNKKNHNPMSLSVPSEEMTYRRHFAKMMKTIPRSFEILRDDVLHQDEKNKDLSTAWGFMGLVLRDHSCFELSMKCYELSLSLNPTDLSVSLSYLHMFEHIGDPRRGLDWAHEYLQQHSELTVLGLSAGTIAALMGDPAHWQRYTSLVDNTKLVQAELADSQRAVVRFRKDDIVIFSGDEKTLKANLVIEPYTDYDNLGPDVDCTLSEFELNLIALYMTVVKFFYLCGILAPLPKLCEAIGKIRKGQRIHKTPVRNEQAYFSTVASLLQYLDPPATPTEATQLTQIEDTIYFIGDSHSLPPSWHVLNIKGKRTLVKNVLVTGMKCWHLRPESDFYPKRTFQERTNLLPEGGSVVFLFGEIDCREGIWKSVDKGRYDTIQEGARVAIHYYLDAVEALRKKRRLANVYIHSVLPILDVTRHFVLPFNVELKSIVQTEYPQLKYLDINVLNPTTNKLDERYTLDNTHIAPTYLPLVEEALNKA